MAKNKKGKRRQGQRKSKTSNGRTPFTGVSSAPAGTNQMLSHYTRFRGEGQGLSMTSCLPICELQFLTAADSDTGSLKFRSYGSGSTRQSGATAILGLQSAISLANNAGSGGDFLYTPTSYISPVFYLMANMFARWRVNKLMFHYTPQSSTTVNGRAVFAFADDPAHPVLNPSFNYLSTGGVPGTTNIPTTTSLLALGDTMAFAPWLPWTLDVSRTVSQNELYTDCPLIWNAANTSWDPVFSSSFDFKPAIRQWALGAISCATLTTESASFDGGVLWMEIDVSLVEFCPITTFADNSQIGPGPLPSLRHRLKLKSTPSSWKSEDSAVRSTEWVANKKADSEETKGLTRLYSLIGEVMQRQCKLQDRFEDMLPLNEEATEEGREISKETRKAYQGLKFHDGSDVTVTAVNPEKVELSSSDPNRSCLQMAEGSDLENSVRKWRARQDALRVIFDDPSYELPYASCPEQSPE